MAEEASRDGGNRKRADEPRSRGRMEVTVVRFDAIRLPSGLYTHRTTKVVIPVPEPQHA
jgi:hypothetical protein